MSEEKEKNPDREDPWIRGKKAQREAIISYEEPKNRKEFLRAFGNFCAVIEESLRGWNGWLKDWPTMEKFSIEDLDAFKKEFQSSAIKAVEVEMDIAVKLCTAYLELLKGLNPSTKPGYAHALYIMHPMIISIVNTWIARLKSGEIINFFSKEDLRKLYQDLRDLAIAILEADIKATERGHQRFKEFFEQEKGLPKLASRLEQELPTNRKRQIYVS